MRKILYFVPAIVYTVGILALNIILRELTPPWYIWAILLWLSGFLLCKGKVWGSTPGLVLAIWLLRMSMQHTGQPVNVEGMLGLTTAIYLFICSFWVWKNVHGAQKCQ